MDLAALSKVEPHVLRSMFPTWLASFVDDPERAAINLERISALTAAWSDETSRGLMAYLGEIGAEHRMYAAHPACRAVSRAWCRDVLLDPRIEGLEHLLAAVERGPTMLVGNHLSYVDANATDAMLAWSGQEALADRLLAAAGPKVYQDLFRRFAAGCINTLPVVQSTRLGHTAKLAPRELARKAMEGLQSAASALSDGYIVLVYPEGSRTRDGHMQPFLKATHRWLAAVPGLSVVPLALVGTDAVMPIDATGLRPGPVSLQFGVPRTVGPDGTSREVLASVHAAIGQMLPAHLQPPSDMPALA